MNSIKKAVTKAFGVRTNRMRLGKYMKATAEYIICGYCAAVTVFLAYIMVEHAISLV